KGLKAIQAAEVVVYDRLVSKDILELAHASAEMIYVGKKLDFHCVPQDQINQILVQKAQEGKRVVRLKGGDSFIFGRGGEELEELAEFGIKYEVVPGITAAAGATAYAGIPL
ncbi:uroporphyrinogen-III C-methyltransferase, partial [Vibrio parahaemolyticus]|uniref:uroporphyrinogen-III C-methyltransferase n=2 Tax=Vibrio TaxID=662 RepID=UPI0017A1C3A2